MNRLDEKGIEQAAKAVDPGAFCSVVGDYSEATRSYIDACRSRRRSTAYRHAKAAITAYLAATSQDEGWLLIDSAPRDGTEILACWDAPTPEYRARGVVFWNGDEWLTAPGNWRKSPTHWRPLPAAPPPPEGADK